MKKLLLALAIVQLLPFTLKAQNTNPVVLEVGGRQIRQQEFMKDFNQSVGDALVSKNASEAEKRKALDEYVELYANFQAKLRDAVRLGFDTTADLRDELARYRKDLAAPYLIDSALLKKIVNEAYERNHYALHAAHILVHVSPDAAPEDTLAAYNRAMELYNRAIKGENFYDLSIEEARRENPGAKVQPTEGELGYFTAFDMVYPFENAAYSLQPGEVSLPVRTRYGYHIIKLFERVEFYGKVTLQHFWSRNHHAEKDMDQLYARLQSGTPFEVIALQSDDLSTAEKGGYIYDATMYQLPQEYVTVLSRLKEGEFSRPFLTRYGWHIVRLVKKDTIPSFEKMEPFYRQRMARDPRGEASRKSFAASARKKYGIMDLTKTPVTTKMTSKKKSKQPVKMMASLDELTAHLDDNVFNAKWRVSDSVFTDLRPLVKVPGKEYNVLDVAKFIRRGQKSEPRVELGYYARQRFEEFLDSIAIVYADSQLEKDYPEFASLLDEYRRGLMIFNYNEEMIWVKAIKDSAGFSEFYRRESAKKSLDNPEDSIYFWHARARVLVFDVADSRCLDSEKAVKILRKAIKNNLSAADMQEALLKKVDSKKCDIDNPVEYGLDLVEKTRQDLLTDDQWSTGVYTVHSGKGYRLLVVQDIIPPCIKGQMEARGYYLNAWQNEVEENLCKELRSKYRVKINHDVVDKIRF